MKQVYEIALSVRIVHVIDGCTDFPDGAEVGDYVGQLICDELTDEKTVVGYDAVNVISRVEKNN